MKITERLEPADVIKMMNLAPLPQEGGFFRQTYRNAGPDLDAKIFEGDLIGKRRIATAIYFFITAGNFSALHRVRSDEIFHFYCGDAIDLIQWGADGVISIQAFGSELDKGEAPQILVPKNHWQGLRLQEGGRWALVGTTVFPGFEYEDFELGSRDSLLAEFPQHNEWVLRFTRGEAST